MRYKGISIKFVHNWKKEKTISNEFYIQARITLDRKSKYFSIDELPKINPKYWSGKSNRWVKDSHPEGSKINSYLVKKLTQLDQYILDSRLNHGLLTFEKIKTEFFRKGSISTLNAYYQEFIDSHKFDAPRTKQAYKTTKDTLDEFSPNIAIGTISEKLLNDFIDWERNTKKLKDVTIDKHLTHIKTIIKEVVKSGLLVKNPIEHSRFKIKPEKADRISLSIQEVKKIWDQKFTEENKHLEKTRDVFIFLCNTGLYYSDVLELKKTNIIDKRLIKGTRTKNNHLYIIPLSETAKLILKKYDSPSDLIFPGLISEPAFNRALKEIAKAAKISKSISNKVGRHTFTDAMISSNKLQRSFVSKMLGHEKESTTQYYYDINENHFLTQIKEFDDFLK